MFPSPRTLPRSIVLMLLLLAACAGTVSAQVELPQRGDRSVYDLAGVISPEHEQAMEQQHLGLLRAGGVAITVIAIPTLEGESIGDFAVRAGQQWGVGRKGEDRGIVVAFALEERKIFIATGYGVEGYLPDGRVGRILDQYVIPHLRRNDFSTGLQQASAALVQASAEEFGLELRDERMAVVRRETREEPGIVSKIFSALFVLFVVYLIVRHPRMALLMLFYGSRGGHGGGGFGGGGFGGSGGFGGGGFGGGGAGRGF